MRHLRRQARPGWRRSGGATADSFPLGGEAPAAEFPANIRAHVQYGDSVCVLAGLLSTYGAVSAGHIHTLLGSLMGVGLSTGTIFAMVSRCASKVGGTLAATKAMLTKEGRRPLRRDGDGCEREDSLGHSSSTKELTCQAVSARRGKEGMGENGVLPDFRGVAVHDCWRPCWKYELPGHAVCCAHLLRELTGIEEFSPGHGWASRLKAPLMDMKRTKGRTMARGEDAIPRKAEVRCGIRPDPGGGRGRLPAPPGQAEGKEEEGKGTGSHRAPEGAEGHGGLSSTTSLCPSTTTRRNGTCATGRPKLRCRAASARRRGRRTIWTSRPSSALAPSTVPASLAPSPQPSRETAKSS